MPYNNAETVAKRQDKYTSVEVTLSARASGLLHARTVYEPHLSPRPITRNVLIIISFMGVTVGAWVQSPLPALFMSPCPIT